ncbi:MAG TPA: TraR/DksA C4-type zinc finger protein [Opitutaceae bacterium]|nr:TraR/DksA C4-type zinc finger protein [Opitutaceae bacterium]
MPTKKTSSAKPSPTAKAAAKPVKPTPVAATPAKPVAKPIPAKPVAAKPAAEAPARPASAKASAKESLRSRILARAKAIKPVAFSLDEAREIAIKSEAENKAKAPLTSAKTIEAQKKAELLAKAEKPAVPNQVKAASLADILGFNPKKRAATTTIDESESIPEKFRRYYKLLLELRGHLTGQLDQHTEETLKRSSKDDAGDLSSYGQHMADAGTDTFDRDFALSLVSSEQEALSEIEAAIQRIKAGTYGICEHTGKPIAKERLLAVPFTRFSAEAQKEIERNRYRARQQAGLFGEGEEGGKIADDDSGGDE